MVSLTTVLFAHTALENASHEDLHWRLNHHRELLDVILGKSDLTPEEAVIRHLHMHYPDPARYSSFAVADALPDAGKAPSKRPKNLKA